MRPLMTATLAAALTVISGAAMAQSYGAGDPAWADTSDPGSIPTARWHHSYVLQGAADPYGYYGPAYSYSTPYQGNWHSSAGYQPRRYGW